jgi:hypothetical protein
MKHLRRLFLLAGLIALGFWGWGLLFTNPQKVIRTRLVRLAELASFSAKEGNVLRVAKVQQMGTFFTDDAQVSVNVPGVESINFTRREELMQATMAARSALNGLQAEFPDLNVNLSPDRQSAVVNVTLNAKIAGQREAIVQELKFTLKSISGNWLITRVETVETLK